MTPYERYTILRDVKQQSDADIAKATGLAPSVFSDWKKGRSTPGVYKLLKIAQFFNVPIEFLITGESPPIQDERTIIRPILKDLLDIASKCPDDEIRHAINFLARINTYREGLEKIAQEKESELQED